MNYGSYRESVTAHSLRWKKILLSALAIGALTVFWFNKHKLANIFIPGDQDATRKAYQVFVEDVRGGDSIVNAFGSFCKEIVNAANIS